jgi:hypothetical protein
MDFVYRSRQLALLVCVRLQPVLNRTHGPERKRIAEIANVVTGLLFQPFNAVDERVPV